MKQLFLAVTLAVCVGLPAGAQEISPGHLAAAVEMVEAAGMREAMQQGMETALQQQMRQNPDLRPLEQLMRGFFEKYLSWEVMRERYARLYAETYTEPELRELTVFYRTPTGQKVARTTPGLMVRGAALGEEVIQPHLGELQQMVMEHLARAGTQP